jgi:hypothetical protein
MISSRTILGCALAAIGLSCVNLDNPFDNPDNTELLIIDSATDFENDSRLRLYTSYTLTVATTVHEHAEKICIEAPGNRLWRRDTIYAPDGREYSRTLSFYDTGYQTIDIALHRRNATTIRRAMRVSVESPLDQRDLTLSAGEICHLSTPAAGDSASILYHWKLDGADTVSSALPEARRQWRSLIGEVSGRLWVTDRGRRHASPADTFRITFTDAAAPVIEAASGKALGDTVVTADTDFMFVIAVWDSSDIRGASINGQAHYLEGNRYARLFANMPHYAQTPLEAVAFAEDIASNRTTRSFYLRYDPSGPRSPLKLTIIGLEDDSVTSRERFPVTGSIIHGAPGETVIVAGSLHDRLFLDTVEIDHGPASWYIEMPLTTGRNSISLLALDTLGGAASDTSSLLVIFDPAAIDTVDPQIHEIIVDSVRVSHFGSSSPAFVRDTACSLTVTAFDMGSGVKRAFMRCRGQESLLHPGAGSYDWRGRITGIGAYASTSVTVGVEDLDGNTAVRTFALRRNAPPVVLESSDIPHQRLLTADSAYVFTLAVHDDDSVAMRLIDAPPAMTTQAGASPNLWRVAWTPALADTGDRTITVTLSDGVTTRAYAWTLTVGSSDAPMLRFAQPAGSPPESLVAGIDTLRIIASLARADAPPFRYVAAIDNTPVFDSVSRAETMRFTWPPSIDDIGVRALTLYAVDSAGSRDTLMRGAPIEIIAANHFPCSLRALDQSGGAVRSGDRIDLTGADAPTKLFFTIEDRDPPQAESYIRWIRRDGVIAWDTLTDRRFSIELDTAGSEPFIEYCIGVRDRGGNIDSLCFSIRRFYQRPDQFGELILWLQAGEYSVVSATAEGVKQVHTWAGTQYPHRTLRVNEPSDAPGKWPVLGHDPAPFDQYVAFNQTAWLLADHTEAALHGWNQRPFTVVAVIRTPAPGAGRFQTLLSKGRQTGIKLGLYEDSLAVMQNGNLFTSSLTIESDAWQIIGMRSAGGQKPALAVDLLYRGAQVRKSIGTTLDFAGGAFVLGSEDGESSSDGWAGDIAEFLYYARELTDSDIREVNAYLRRTYGLTP